MVTGPSRFATNDCGRARSPALDHAGALFDEHGRGLAYQQPGGRYEERTIYETDRIVVTGVVETFLEHGRPVRSMYAVGGEEHYHYDGDRLVAIDEPDNLDMTGQGASATGGRLELHYDDRGLRAISDRWERLDEPWGTRSSAVSRTSRPGSSKTWNAWFDQRTRSTSRSSR